MDKSHSVFSFLQNATFPEVIILRHSIVSSADSLRRKVRGWLQGWEARGRRPLSQGVGVRGLRGGRAVGGAAPAASAPHGNTRRRSHTSVSEY